MTRVIEKQVSHGVYISAHLRGEAVDVRTRTMTSSEKEALRSAALESGGYRAHVEPDHYHFEFR